MKIIIANSNPWFVISDQIKEKNEILLLKNNLDLNLQNVDNFNPEIIFFPHWNWIVSEDIHKKYNCVLFHTAPLPYGRGGSPIQNLILLGYKKSPVYALKMMDEVDCGPIYSGKYISLEGKLSKIFKELNLVVNDLIKELIDDLPNPTKQEGTNFTFKRLSKKDNNIPKDISLDQFFDRIRMLDDPSYPNAYIKYGNFIIEFEDVNFLEEEINCKVKIIEENKNSD